MNLTLAKSLKDWSPPEDLDLLNAIDAYLDGDHYQDGAGWIGPVPREGNEAEQLRKIMINDGVFASAIKRALLAVVGNEPYFYVTDKNPENAVIEASKLNAQNEPDPAKIDGAEKVPAAGKNSTKTVPVPPQAKSDAQDTPPEGENTPVDPNAPLDPQKTLDRVKTESKNQKKIDEANDLITNRWDRDRIHKLLMQLTMNLICKDRAVSRIFLPEDAFDEDEDYGLNDFKGGALSTFVNSTEDEEGRAVDVSFASIEDAMNALTVQILPLGESGFVKDVNGRVVGAFYKYTHPDTKKEETEVTYYSRKEKKTAVEIIDVSGRFEEFNRVHYELDGRLTIFEMSGATIVRKDILTHVRAVDHSSTMLVMNNSFAGFRERLFLNAEPPTKTEWRNGVKLEIDDELDNGPGTDLFVTGQAIENPLTKEITNYATPSVIYKDPVNQDGLLNSINHHIQRILENMFQAHILIAGDATSSGTSRQQAVQDHIASLNLIEQEVDAFMRWLIETMLHLAADLAGKPGYFSELKAVSECRISAVRPTSEERKNIIEEYNNDLRSRENAMTAIGVDDPVAERMQIIREKIEDMDTGLETPPPGQIPDPSNPGRTIPDPSLLDPATGMPMKVKKPTSPGNF